MLSLRHPVRHSPAPLCDGLTRRDWLTVGGLGAFGLTLPGLLHARDNAPAKPKKAKSVILLFLLGAPPQQETWDPKPNSAAEFRGDMKPMPSATPGLLVGETMLETAKRTNRIAVLRALQTRDNAHSSSGYTMTTGVPHAPMSAENVKPGAPNDWPSVGAIARRFLQHRTSLPAAVTLPEQAANDGNITWPGQDAGFLGRAHDPWLIDTDPNKPDFGIPGLVLPTEVPHARFGNRLTLREQIDARFARYEATAAETPHSARARKAVDMIASPEARAAFDLNAEAPKLRDRYGRTRFGQSCLLARRLVEAGVPFVTINDGGWDHHSDIFGALQKRLPNWDQTVAALIGDLADRGLLDSTLVIALGEFGRTPKISTLSGQTKPGRDHWANAMSVLFAGGGCRGGQVVGATDRKGYAAVERVLSPEHFASTIYRKLGIDPDKMLYTPQGRPSHIVSNGTPIKELMG